MSSILTGLLSLAPVAVVFLFLVILRWPAKRAMAIAYGVVTLLALFVWQVSGSQVAAATIQGLVQAILILWIVFGALFLLQMMRESGAVDTIRNGFVQLSPDRRVQALIIGWLFGSFLEGVSGFGAPLVILSPLLLTLGFPSAAAAMVAMLIQSTPVTFGAIGTPIILGLGSGLMDDQVVAHAAALGFANWESYLHHIAVRAAALHAITGLLIPLFMIALLSRWFGPRRAYLDGLRAWPFALLAGLSFTVPYLVVAYFLGPEFPTIIGALVGLLLVTLAVRTGFLVPKETFDFAPRDEWDPDWTGTMPAEPEIDARPRSLTLLRAWVPYIAVAVLLVATRLPALGLRRLLTSVVVGWTSILGTDISVAWEPLYSPGTVFLVVSLCVPLMHRMRREQVPRAVRAAGKQLWAAAPALLLAVPMVRVFINSGGGATGLPSMPMALADAALSVVGAAWPAFAPWIGGLGSFVSGSNTFSDMMFALFQWTVGMRIGADAELVVASQSLGGAAGNMIAVHNVVAAAAVVGLIGREGTLIRRVLIPLVYYLTVGGALSYTWQYGVGFHVGTVSFLILAAVTTWVLVREKRRLSVGGPGTG